MSKQFRKSSSSRNYRDQGRSRFGNSANGNFYGERKWNRRELVEEYSQRREDFYRRSQNCGGSNKYQRGEARFSDSYYREQRDYWRASARPSESASARPSESPSIWRPKDNKAAHKSRSGGTSAGLKASETTSKGLKREPESNNRGKSWSVLTVPSRSVRKASPRKALSLL